MDDGSGQRMVLQLVPNRGLINGVHIRHMVPMDAPWGQDGLSLEDSIGQAKKVLFGDTILDPTN